MLVPARMAARRGATAWRLLVLGLLLVSMLGAGTAHSAKPAGTAAPAPASDTSPAEVAAVTPEQPAEPPPDVSPVVLAPAVPPAPPAPEVAEPLAGRRQDWGFVPNPRHQVPEVMAQTEKELKRYNALWHGPTDDKVIYLTFDGGGDSRETPRILDILKRQQVKVTFFVTGDFLDQSPAMIKRMAVEGHGIGNHTVTHPHLNQLSAAKFDAEIDTVADKVKAITGKRPLYFRCPFGTYSAAVLGRLQEKGYRTAFWSIAMVDWLPMAGGKNQAVHGVLDHLHNGAVVLLHVGSPDDVNALEDIIVRTRGEGYRFGDPETL